MFQVGGTDCYLHKYIGPKPPSDDDSSATIPTYGVDSVTNIQDLLFLENRDRKYDADIYTIRGLYNVQNIDFNLSQFGLFIDNDTLFMTIHINDFIKYIGRKPLSGDVLELPHLRDEFALGDADYALPRYYVIEDVGRASEGFSVTWYPHLYRLKLRKITDNQQFSDILNKPANIDTYAGEYDPLTTYYPGQTITYNSALYKVTVQTVGRVPPDTDYYEPETSLRDILSTYAQEIAINDAIVAQAEADAPRSGYETRHFYTLAVDEQGNTLLTTADQADIDASLFAQNLTASTVSPQPARSGYTGYLLGDGTPYNGAAFGHGIQFPAGAAGDDYFLRTDFMPNRLFRFDGTRWIKLEDAVRMTMTNNDTRQTQKTSFINNTNTHTIGGEVIEERQSLSKALKYKPEADV